MEMDKKEERSGMRMAFKTFRLVTLLGAAFLACSLAIPSLTLIPPAHAQASTTTTNFSVPVTALGSTLQLYCAGEDVLVTGSLPVVSNVRFDEWAGMEVNVDVDHAGIVGSGTMGTDYYHGTGSSSGLFVNSQTSAFEWIELEKFNLTRADAAATIWVNSLILYSIDAVGQVSATTLEATVGCI